MQVRSYRFYKFNGAWRLSLCNDGTLGRICKSAPTPLPVSVNLLGTKTPPRQAAPPGADVMQSPQCICTSHLPSTGGELAMTVLFQYPESLT